MGWFERVEELEREICELYDERSILKDLVREFVRIEEMVRLSGDIGFYPETELEKRAKEILKEV